MENVCSTSVIAGEPSHLLTRHASRALFSPLTKGRATDSNRVIGMSLVHMSQQACQQVTASCSQIHHYGQHCAMFFWNTRRYSRRFSPQKRGWVGARISAVGRGKRASSPCGERVRENGHRSASLLRGLACGKGRRRDKEGKVANRLGWLLSCASVRNQD